MLSQICCNNRIGTVPEYTLTTNFYKTSLTQEIDYYTYKKLPDKNSGFKILEKSGRVATLSTFFQDLKKNVLLKILDENQEHNFPV